MDSAPPARFTLLKRRKDLTHEEFNHHWHGVHGALLASLPDFRRCNQRYTQNHLLRMPASLAGQYPEDGRWDGFAQTFQRIYPEGFLDFFDQPAFEDVVRPDEDKFLDPAASTTTYTRQHVIKDGPASGVKYMAFLRAADGMDQKAFLDYLFNKHVALLKEVKPFWERVTRYCQYHARPELFRGSSEMEKTEAFSGVVEIYFDSMSDLEAAFNNDKYKSRVEKDALKFVKSTSLHFVTEDYPVKYEEDN